MRQMNAVKASRTAEKAEDSRQMENGRIFIIGPHPLRNEIMAYFLGREMGVPCSAGEDFETAGFQGRSGFTGNTLLLLDCLNEDLKACRAKKSILDREDLGGAFVVPFDVRRDAGIEEAAVKWGLRGLFFEDEPIDQFLLGIQAILRGDLWLSREIMRKHILGEYAQRAQGKDPAAILTRREKEVLEAIASGAGNEEIAEGLHVSLSTVKTHVYSIYKKINVPNRLQAALWAAKYL